MSILMGTLAIATIITTGRMTYYGSVSRAHKPEAQVDGKRPKREQHKAA